MTKIFFKNASNLIMSALIFTFVGVSCQKNPVQPSDDSTGSLDLINARSKSSASLQTVSLKVTVNNTGNKITNDGAADYTNGTQNVQAIIDQYGNFIFNTQASSHPRSSTVYRGFNYNFSQPLTGYTVQNITVDHKKVANFNMIKSNLSTDPFIPLQNLGINGNPATECVTLGGGFSSATTDYRVSFHRGAEDVSTTASSLVLVTRTKVKATNGTDEWTITPSGCSGNQNIGALRSGDGSTLIGYYSLPFSFTLTALPK